MKKNDVKLDAFEQDIEDRAETLVSASAKTRARFGAVVDSARKSRSISLRFSSYDLEKVKEKAGEAGLPYQTFISMVIHKYITGQFWDKAEAQKAFSLLVR